MEYKYIKIPPKFDSKQTNVSITYPRPMATYSHYDGDGRVFLYYVDDFVSAQKKNAKDIYEEAKNSMMSVKMFFLLCENIWLQATI